MQKTQIEDLGTAANTLQEPFPNIHKKESKPWYQCQTEGCHYIKSGPRAKLCKECAKKVHQKVQEKTTLKIIIRLKKRSVEE